MAALRQRLDGKIEPPGLKSASRSDRLWFYDRAGRVALEQLQSQLSRGIGADGRKMPPRKRLILPDGSSGPVMTPHDERSRAITLSDYMATDHGLLMFWHAGTGHRSYKAARKRQARTGKRPLKFGEILAAHAAGEVRNAPPRDTRLCDASIHAVKTRMAREWRAYRKAPTRKAAMKPSSVPVAPLVAVPLRKLPPTTVGPVLIEARAFRSQLPPRQPVLPKLPKPAPPLVSPPAVVMPAPRPARISAPVPPPPDPLQPYRDWRPARTEAEAVEWMTTRLGVKRVFTDLPSTPVHEGDRAFATADDRLQHMNKIISEWNDLRVRYPGLPEAPIQKFHAINAVRGYSSVPAKGAQSVALAAKGREWDDREWDRIRTRELATGRTWGQDRQGTQIEDNFRHELAHALTTTDVYDEFVGAIASGPHPRPLPASGDLTWFKDHVSEYAAENLYEAIAESFTLYTRRGYVPGTLPLNLEAFFRRLLGA